MKSKLVQALTVALLLGAAHATAYAKLPPPPSEEQKAKAEEAKAKAAAAAKLEGEQLTKAQDGVAQRYIKEQKAKGVTVKPTPIAAAPAPAPALHLRQPPRNRFSGRAPNEVPLGCAPYPFGYPHRKEVPLGCAPRQCTMPAGRNTGMEHHGIRFSDTRLVGLASVQRLAYLAIGSRNDFQRRLDG